MSYKLYIDTVMKAAKEKYIRLRIVNLKQMKMKQK